MKVAIIIATHGRTKLANIILQRLMYATSSPHLTNEYHVCLGMTEGDEITDIMRCSLFYRQYENEPLGRKWNSLCRDVCYELSPDYVMILGSDDLISDGLLQEIDYKINQGYTFIGITGLYFYSLDHRRTRYGECGYWHSDSKNIQGPCRTISVDILKNLDYQPWPNERMSGLDRGFMRNTERYMDKEKTAHISLQETDTYCVDVKVCGNINGLKNLYTAPINPLKLLNSFMYGHEIKDIMDLKEGADKEFIKRWGRSPSIYEDKINILFYPHPLKGHPVSRVSRILKDVDWINYHNDPSKPYDLHIFWSYTRRLIIPDRLTLTDNNVINRGCWNIGKEKVNDIFNDIRIDPTIHKGICVKKRDYQCGHRWHKIVDCPVPKESGYVYQKYIEDIQDGYYVRYRLFYMGGITHIIKIYEINVFENTKDKIVQVAVDDVLTRKQQEDIVRKCNIFGFDFGEIDFLMDEGVPVIIDMNDHAGGDHGETIWGLKTEDGGVLYDIIDNTFLNFIKRKYAEKRGD